MQKGFLDLQKAALAWARGFGETFSVPRERKKDLILDDSLEHAIKADPTFLARIKDVGFARVVYAALCNREWITKAGQRWSCTWRYAGGLVAEIRAEGEDYLDFYVGFGDDEWMPADASGLEAEFLAILGRLGWNEITPGQEVEAALQAEEILKQAEALPATAVPDWYGRLAQSKLAPDDTTFLGRIRRAALHGQLDQAQYWKLLKSVFLSEEARRILEERTRAG